MTAVTFDVLMKHSTSALPDLAVRVRIDRRERLVTLGVESIDSSLLLDLVTRILPQDHDVVAFTEDGAGGTPPAPPFGLRIHFDGRFLGARVTRASTGVDLLRLESASSERRRMALDSAPRVLEAIHGAGFEAVIGGSVGRGEKGHADSDLDVFVYGTLKGFAAGQIVALAEGASTVPVDLHFEHWIANTHPANFLMRRHLAWDPKSKRCLAMPGLLEAWT